MSAKPSENPRNAFGYETAGIAPEPFDELYAFRRDALKPLGKSPKLYKSSENAPEPSESPVNAPKPSERSGNAPTPSESLANAPEPSESPVNAPKPSERSENAPTPSESLGNALKRHLESDSFSSPATAKAKKKPRKKARQGRWKKPRILNHATGAWKKAASKKAFKVSKNDLSEGSSRNSLSRKLQQSVAAKECVRNVTRRYNKNPKHEHRVNPVTARLYKKSTSEKSKTWPTLSMG